jgi:Domain of unknown function (DUF6901)
MLMDTVRVLYRFRLGDGTTEVMELKLDSHSLELDSHATDVPDWARLEFNQCPHCPLDPVEHPHCPVAAGIADVIHRFDGVFSHDELDLEVVTGERRFASHTTAQRAIGSLLGLLIATSGCPYTNYLKPMAQFHLPLATEKETIFRVAGMYLLAQYFVKQAGGESDLELAGLTKIYDDLHILNASIARRLRSATRTDSSVNAIILLDMFTNLVPYSIEDHLDEIRHLLTAFLTS